jgi:hypothetical protein
MKRDVTKLFFNRCDSYGWQRSDRGAVEVHKIVSRWKELSDFRIHMLAQSFSLGFEVFDKDRAVRLSFGGFKENL